MRGARSGLDRQGAQANRARRRAWGGSGGGAWQARGGGGAGQGAGPGLQAARSPGRLRGPGRDPVSGLLQAPPPKPAPWGRDSRPSVPCSAAVSASRQSSRGFVLSLITKTELWYGKTSRAGKSLHPLPDLSGQSTFGVHYGEGAPGATQRSSTLLYSRYIVRGPNKTSIFRRQSDVCKSKKCELFFRYM